MDLKYLASKNVAILGVGVEGVALASFLLGKCKSLSLLDKKTEKEIVADPSAQDPAFEGIIKNPEIIKYFGTDYLGYLSKFDVVFRSPGVKYLTPELQLAQSEGVEISSQIKLFFDLCPAKIIGVTGTKGKGTTASLISEILKKTKEPKNLRNKEQNLLIPNYKCQTSKDAVIARNEAIYSKEIAMPSHKGERLAMTNRNDIIAQSTNSPINSPTNVYLAGNIGTPAISLLDVLKPDDLVVLELSSFQLQDLHKSPELAVVLNISSDHLNYHQNHTEYIEAKIPIVKFQKKSDLAVINMDYLTSFEFASHTIAQSHFFSGKKYVEDGAYVRQVVATVSLGTQEEVVLTLSGQEETICKDNEIKLVGHHNLENIAAAALAASLLGVNAGIIREVVRGFSGLPHRLELVGNIAGIAIYNDSFSTNPEPTIAAVKAFADPKLLILGGSTKGADFDQMAKEIVSHNVKAVAVMGDESDRIKQSLVDNYYDGKIVEAGYNFMKAINDLLEVAQSGEVLILSPACASFDMFKNYKDRGDKFKAIIVELTSTDLHHR